jgi:hypothetical protein
MKYRDDGCGKIGTVLQILDDEVGIFLLGYEFVSMTSADSLRLRGRLAPLMLRGVALYGWAKQPVMDLNARWLGCSFAGTRNTVALELKIWPSNIEPSCQELNSFGVLGRHYASNCSSGLHSTSATRQRIDEYVTAFKPPQPAAYVTKRMSLWITSSSSVPTPAKFGG